MRSTAFAVAAVLAAFSVTSCQAAQQTQRCSMVLASAERLPLAVPTKVGERCFQVDVARTPEEQAQGLMYRQSLPADGGMLFPFAQPRIASFWMKNTVIPLDMIFIRADGTIARIAAETVPYSLKQVESGEPVVAVLELAGGRAAALGISAGDRVAWPGGPARR